MVSLGNWFAVSLSAARHALLLVLASCYVLAGFMATVRFVGTGMIGGLQFEKKIAAIVWSFLRRDIVCLWLRVGGMIRLVKAEYLKTNNDY